MNSLVTAASCGPLVAAPVDVYQALVKLQQVEEKKNVFGKTLKCQLCPVQTQDGVLWH